MAGQSLVSSPHFSRFWSTLCIPEAIIQTIAKKAGANAVPLLGMVRIPPGRTPHGGAGGRGIFFISSTPLHGKSSLPLWGINTLIDLDAFTTACEPLEKVPAERETEEKR
jgi:hypothetical protein